MRVEILKDEWFDKIVPLIQSYKESIGEDILIETQLFDLKKQF